MENIKVGFVGCGMMGSALIKGISKSLSGKNIFVCDTDSVKVENLVKELGVVAKKDSVEVATEVDYLFIAVKPNFVGEVLKDITSLVAKEDLPVFVSIAAGLEIEKLKKSALTVSRFIRLMPNLPATVGEAMIAMCADEDITAEEKATVKSLLKKAGTVEEVSEKLMDCVTGISGSGPAYGFVFIEALADAAVKLGMPRNQAYIYAAQTLKGAAAMVLETKEHPASLKDGVCSPGGTTIAAVEKLEELGFRNAVIKAAVAATERSMEMGGRK